MSNDFQLFMKNSYKQMVEWRRYLHQNPELSFQEKETSGWIAEQLELLGCKVERNVGGYGLMVQIDSGQPGPVVALRADIDALPIQDEKTCAYRSQKPQIMHACGHDGHTASLLAIAAYYKQATNWSGSRRLLFQPAEEVTPGGAKQMIEAGALEGVDAIYGVHLWTPIAIGKVASAAGALMSAADEFTIEITGLGGHGGLPHESTDTIVAGSDFVSAIQKIISRNINPLDAAVITIGSFHAGSAPNVMAETCVLRGTVRSFKEGVRSYVQKRIEEILVHTCGMHNTSYRMEYKKGYPPLINDGYETERYKKIAAALFGEQNTLLTEPLTIAEDFAYYLQQRPGVFMLVGAGNPEVGASYPHHHAKFDIDEESIIHAATLLVAMAEDYAKAAVK